MKNVCDERMPYTNLADEMETDVEGNIEWAFANKLHWYNTQRKYVKKREFWRAVIYALTRPEEYKRFLLEKAKTEKDRCEAILQAIQKYGVDEGWISKKQTDKY